MKHFHDIDVLTTNTEDNKVVYEFNIDKGLITEAGIYFPSGVNGVVLAKIFYQTHQIHPRNQEGWCHGTNGWESGDLYFPVTDAPLKIRVEAYTTGAYFDHEIKVMIEIMPWVQVPQWNKIIYVLERLAKMLGIKTLDYPVTEQT